jgi:hypothetical protein
VAVLPGLGLRHDHQTIEIVARVEAGGDVRLRAARPYASSAGSDASGLGGRDVDRQTVEVVRELDLTSEPTAVAPVGDAQVKEVLLEVSGAAHRLGELLPDPDMTRGAGGVAPAFADNSGDTVAQSGTHDALPRKGIDDVHLALAAYVDDLRHRSHPFIG